MERDELWRDLAEVGDAVQDAFEAFKREATPQTRTDVYAACHGYVQRLGPVIGEVAAFIAAPAAAAAAPAAAAENVPEPRRQPGSTAVHAWQSGPSRAVQEPG